MTACSYANTGRVRARLIAAVPLDHQLAESLAKDLNNAATASRGDAYCLRLLPFSLLIARDQQGHTMPPVRVSAGCAIATFTNGITNRFLRFQDSALRTAATQVARHLKPR